MWWWIHARCKIYCRLQTSFLLGAFNQIQSEFIVAWLIFYIAARELGKYFYCLATRRLCSERNKLSSYFLINKHRLDTICVCVCAIYYSNIINLGIKESTEYLYSWVQFATRARGRRGPRSSQSISLRDLSSTWVFMRNWST